MIRLLTTFFLLSVVWCHAAPLIALEWEPSPDADVNNYRLYVGNRTGDYYEFRDLGNVTNTVFTNLIAGKRVYFVVTAMNAEGAESDPSNEIDFLMPAKPAAPAELRITQRLQSASSPLGPWREIGTLQSIVAPVDVQQFYRSVVSIQPPTP